MSGQTKTRNIVFRFTQLNMETAARGHSRSNRHAKASVTAILWSTRRTRKKRKIKTPLGPMYLIYRPKGKGGRKDEIKANWVEDSNMNAEKAKDPQGHPILGRFHGFSATGISLAEFQKIVDSLHPINANTGTAPAAAGK